MRSRTYPRSHFGDGTTVGGGHEMHNFAWDPARVGVGAVVGDVVVGTHKVDKVVWIALMRVRMGMRVVARVAM